MVAVAKWDTAEFLTNPERVAAYLRVSMEEDSPAEFREALGNVVRSKGLAEIAKKVGVNRQALYRALSPEGNPSMDTVVSVLKELGLKLHVEPV